MRAWTDSVQFLRGVGPQMARRLERLGIHSVRDLLFHVPSGYRDRRSVTPIAGLSPGIEASVLATLAGLRPVRRARGRQDLHGTLRDETGLVHAVWFNQAYLGPTLSVGSRYLFSGSVQAYRGLELQNPEFEPAEAEASHLHVGRVIPRYPLTEGVSERWLRARVRAALDELPNIPEVLPDAWLARFGLPSLARALEQVHFPVTPDSAEPARRRLALEEILTLQVALAYARRRHRVGHRAAPLQEGADAAAKFVAALPFALTGAQSRALESIGQELDRETPMRRLLLGDVGSGKTVVALAAATRAAAAGFQAAILAPTSILAEQHAATATRLLFPVGVDFGLLTASTPAQERRRLLAGFASGQIPVAIGTHALLEREIAFRHLTLVVVDEQQRFGVRQRIALTLAGTSAGAEDRSHPDGLARSPHLLVMTATPIPRSLALTIYGDLDLSVLDEKPPGRTPIETTLLPAGPGALPDLLRQEIAAGGSAFVVYPLVRESDTLDLKAATEMAEALAAIPDLAAAGVVLAHGKLSPSERRSAIGRFRAGEVRILVATTVIEVGLDVPGATLVVIEHPERFGLAQLHQLRGRVGRADRPGRCVLVTGSGMGDTARRRLQAFRTLSDGFRLAEEDLRLRGPGEFLGTSQHGFPEFRAADPLLDTDLIEAGREWGPMLLERGQTEGGEHRVRQWIEAHFAGADRYLGSG